MPPEVVEALKRLDRSTVSEVRKLLSPPSAIRDAFQVVWLFLEIFLYERIQRSQYDELPEASWEEIQTMLAGVDLTAELPKLTPAFVAMERFALVTPQLKQLVKEHSLKEVRNASEPVSYLWLWCATILQCVDAIQSHEEAKEDLQDYEQDEKEVSSFLKESKHQLEEVEVFFQHTIIMAEEHVESFSFKHLGSPTSMPSTSAPSSEEPGDQERDRAAADKLQGQSPGCGDLVHKNTRLLMRSLVSVFRQQDVVTGARAFYAWKHGSMQSKRDAQHAAKLEATLETLQASHQEERTKHKVELQAAQQQAKDAQMAHQASLREDHRPRMEAVEETHRQELAAAEQRLRGALLADHSQEKQAMQQRFQLQADEALARHQAEQQELRTGLQQRIDNAAAEIEELKRHQAAAVGQDAQPQLEFEEEEEDDEAACSDHPLLMLTDTACGTRGDEILLGPAGWRHSRNDELCCAVDCLPASYCLFFLGRGGGST
uniref:Uncharacterized protein n=2 Tax=Rhizochromulina marina TaxID=1034831 RepID=A0A7S2SVP4_9STRA|mmetsp:Transcript_8695/g.24743  ORF Transcript_8695/g.24743 Transcript_8695/m.24743 type:complete len:488 (+) Transcript_8695:1225-2688(+)